MEVFDRSTGQVYTETVSYQVKSMAPSLDQKICGLAKPVDPAKYKNPSGCASLRDMALRSCTWNINSFLPETLKDVEWHYANQILQKLESSRNLTLTNWNMFRRAFPNRINRNQSFYFAETAHRRPDELHYLAKFSTKLDSSCLTFLCIRGLHLKFRDLLTLSDIHTLSGLAIGQEKAYPGTELTDLHMRNWGRAVREKQALKSLRVIFLCDFGPSASDILQGVSSFPALHLACLGTSGYHEAKKLNVDPTQGQWQPVDLTPKGDKPQTIWTGDQRIHISILVKIFDMSRKMSQLPSRAEAGDTSLYLSYKADPLTRYKQHDQDTRYYVRLPDREVPSEMDSLDKSQSFGHHSQSRPTKKRKVREGKQKDIGSLLGSFG